MSQPISIPTAGLSHPLLQGLPAHAEGLEGVAGAKLIGGHLEVSVAAGFDENAVRATLHAAGFRCS